jgi:hypothetical protein
MLIVRGDAQTLPSELNKEATGNWLRVRLQGGRDPAAGARW